MLTQGTRNRILIIGGGASGTLLALELIRRIESPLDLDIAEPRLQLGQGVAYGTQDNRHLLNVVASKMSAKHEEPDHFVMWGNLLQKSLRQEHNMEATLMMFYKSH